MKNLLLMFSISAIGGIALTSSFNSSFSKSTFIDCKFDLNKNRLDSKACEQVLETGSDKQKQTIENMIFIKTTLGV